MLLSFVFLSLSSFLWCLRKEKENRVIGVIRYRNILMLVWQADMSVQTCSSLVPFPFSEKERMHRISFILYEFIPGYYVYTCN